MFYPLGHVVAGHESAKLNAAIEALPADEWLARHDAVSEEDFANG